MSDYGNYQGNYNPHELAGNPSPLTQGGYIPASQDSPSQKQEKGGILSLTPCTIRQLLNAKQAHADDIFRVDGQELSHVKVIGQIKYLQETTTHLTFEIDDGTASIKVSYWMEEITQHTQHSLRDGEYVKLIGNLRCFNEQRSLLPFKVRVIEDFNEITFHFAEVIRAHLCHTQEPVQTDEVVYQPDQTVDRLAEAVKRIVEQNPADQQGIHFQDILQRLQASGLPASDAQLSEVLNKFAADGHMFTTIDEYHWNLCQED